MRKLVNRGFIKWLIEYGTHASSHMNSSGSPALPTDKWVGLTQEELKRATARTRYRRRAGNDGAELSLRGVAEPESRAVIKLTGSLSAPRELAGWNDLYRIGRP